jgi:hypothetical protein
MTRSLRNLVNILASSVGCHESSGDMYKLKSEHTHLRDVDDETDIRIYTYTCMTIYVYDGRMRKSE